MTMTPGRHESLAKLAFRTLAVVLAAALLRLALVGPLGSGIPYLTFYPAVMIAALWGGFPSGLLATLGSALVVFFVILRGHMAPPEILGMAIFTASSLGIAALVESRRRQVALTAQANEDLRRDIAERRRVEAQSQRMHSLLLDSQALAHVGGWEMDLAANTLFWTEETYRIHEISPDEYAPTLESALAFCVPEAVRGIREAMRRAVEEGQPFDLELELITARKRRIWVHASGRPIMDAHGPTMVLGAIQDITGQKQLQEQKHRAIFEHSSLGICWNDPEGVYREVNPALLAITGYQEAEILGTPGGRFTHPDDRPAHLAQFQAMRRGEQDRVQMELRWIRKDGRIIWVMLSVDPVRDASGRLQFYVATVEDITGKREAQEQVGRLLREKEIILATANAGISLLVDRRQVWVNQWVADVLQYTREELEGQSTRMLYPSQEAYDRRGREAYPVLATGATYETVQELVRKDGQSLWIHYNGKAIDPADLSKGTLWVLNDVTAQRRTEEALLASEQKYSTLFRILPTGVVLVDEAGRIVDVNPAAERILGASRAELETMGNRDPLWRIIRPDGSPCPPEDDVTVTALRENRAVENVELGLVHPDGSIGWNLVSATPMPVKGLGVAWVAMDITARRRAEADLAELNRELEERVRAAIADLRQKDRMLMAQSRLAAMGEMIGHIAHQWRQPLNALSLLLINLGDAQRYGELDAGRLEASLAQGDLLIQNMSSTITAFRTFFRPEKDAAPFSVLEQARAAVALVEASFAEAGIGIAMDATEDLRLFGFPNEYAQALLNLLTNAKQAILEGGRHPGRVALRIARENGFCRLTVRDNGPGIAPHLLERIFEPYFSTREAGTGIGLYMSKQIIEGNMSGRITARNLEDGAEFSVLMALSGDKP